MTFSVSLLIGVLIGILVALLLKHTHIRRYPQIESCLILLIAYESYFSPTVAICPVSSPCYFAELL